MSGPHRVQANSRVAGSGQAYNSLYGGDFGFHPHHRAFPFSAGANKEHYLSRLHEPDPCYVQSSESAITTTLSIGTENTHAGKDMDASNPGPGCWSWSPQIASHADVPRDGGSASGAKRKRPPKGITTKNDFATRNDLGSTLGLGQGSSPIDIRGTQGAGSYSGAFCFDMDSPTALSLGQMDPISDSPDSQGSMFGSVRSRVSDGFLSIGSPMQGVDGLLYSQQSEVNQSGESKDSGAMYSAVGYDQNAGVHLQLGQRGNLIEAVTRGGRSLEGTRRGGMSRGNMQKDERANFLLELGPMGNSGQNREVQNLASMRHSRSQSDMILELGLSENMSEVRQVGTPAVGPFDEGSSSARWTKGGGFMPSLLMANPLLGPNYDPHQHDKAPKSPPTTNSGGDGNLLEHDLTRMEQDLSTSMRASTVCPTSNSGASGGSEKLPKMCKFKGCGKGARGASGLCIAHGGGRRCEKQGCNKGAEGRTVYCKAHGGGRRCQRLGCTKSAEGKTDYCIGHGGGRRCSSEGCAKAARGRSGLCIRHGGGKRCQTAGCTKSAEGYSGLCISHGGGRRCQYPACTKGAQGSTMFCKAHGGGKRCMIAGCNKGAEGSTPLCKGHGGGKRCMYEGGGICTKSVHGGTSFCVAHGGGKRCAVEGCSKSARGRTDNCVRHGGGKRCKSEGCGKSAQGSTDFCKAHGGGKRCQWGAEGSPWFAYASNGVSWAGGTMKPNPCERFARGKTGLCATHSALVQDTRVHAGSVIGPGLSPGLFRGLVSGSGQAQAATDPSASASGLTSSHYDRTVMGRDDEAQDHDESTKETHSSDDDDDMSGIESASTGGWTSSGVDVRATESMLESGLTVAGSRHFVRSGFALPHGGTNSMTADPVGGPSAPTTSQVTSTPSSQSAFPVSRFPPLVLVPPSMQHLGPMNATPSSRSHHNKFTEVPSSGTSEDGAFNMSSLSLPEGRVHGGGLMQMLARDLRLGNEIMEGTGLQLSSSKYTTYPKRHASAFHSTGTLEEGGQSNSQSVDVGQFLATD